jgi:hypothetical protein
VRVRSIEEKNSNESVEDRITKAQLKPFDEVNGVHKFKMPEIKVSNTSGK